MKKYGCIHNVEYFKFIDMAVDRGSMSALPVCECAAKSFVGMAIKMLREEFEIAERGNGGDGIKRLKKILNISSNFK